MNTMNKRIIIVAAAFVAVGIILTIYIYDIFSCILRNSPIPIVELLTFLAILIGTIAFVVIFRKKL